MDCNVGTICNMQTYNNTLTSDITLASIANGTIEDVNNNLDVEAINQKLDKDIEARRYQKKKKSKSDRSTSSSSGERASSNDGSGGDSLEGSSSSSSSSDSTKKKDYRPKSSAERKGWKKWHRKCHPCPEDMVMKWKDPRINWICGAYQRARRSFKSLCMMHFRNCQDGTMFIKIHEHRCTDDDPKEKKPHGDHFFYDYKVRLSKESASSSNSEGALTSSMESSETY